MIKVKKICYKRLGVVKIKRKNLKGLIIAFLGVIVIISLVLTGCGAKDKENSNGAAGELAEIANKGADIIANYSKMIEAKKPDKEMVEFIKANIANAPEGIADDLFYGAANIKEKGKIKVDMSMFEPYKDKLQPYTAEYMKLLNDRIDSPVFDSTGKLLLPLKDILERARVTEEFMGKYPEFHSLDKVKSDYNLYMKAAIKGNNGEGSNQFIKPGENALDKASILEYSSFADANPNTMSGESIKEYIGTLKKSNNTPNAQAADKLMKKSQKNVDKKYQLVQ